MEASLQQSLETMIGCSIDRMPNSLVECCGRAEELIKRVKPYGGLMSTQVLAVLVVGWEREFGCPAKEQFLDALRIEQANVENSE